MDPWSMIGSGLSGAISGAINWLGGREEQDRARKANVEQWEREVQINKPVTKVKWLEEAKLNKALAYGGMGNLSGMAHVEPVRPDVQTGDLSKFSQIRNLDAQNASIVASTLVSEEERKKLLKENDLLQKQIDHINWLSKNLKHPVSGHEPMPTGVLNETVAKIAEQPKKFWGDVAENFGKTWLSEGEGIKQQTADRYQVRQQNAKRGGGTGQW